jgi:hypothetical protein
MKELLNMKRPEEAFTILHTSKIAMWVASRLPAALLLLWSIAGCAAEPGTILPPNAEPSSIKRGSVLVYNFYTSSASGVGSHNTRFSLTNTHTTNNVNVALFFVANNDLVRTVYLFLTRNQTVALLASNLDPGVTGYLIAVAVDALGCPLSHNFLLGDARVKLGGEHEAQFNAVAFAALYSGTLPSCNAASTFAELAFDDVSYNRPPRLLAADKLHSPQDGYSTKLVINRFGGDLRSLAPSSVFTIAGQLYNDAGQPTGFAFSAGTQTIRELDATFPTATPFEAALPVGCRAWMKLYAVEDIALLGAIMEFYPTNASNTTHFSGGRNLRMLTRIEASAILTIPISPPNN